ncbi:MAG: 5'-3' exonuclease, partial [Actinomycetota bacterium]
MPGDLTLLVDASSLLYRAFFALPDTIRAPDGTVVNAAHGFIDMIARLIATERPGGMVCAFDEDWRPAWRVELLPEYKTHRVAGEAGADGVEGPEEQEPVIREILGIAGIACAGAAGFEAEDVIATIAKRAPSPRVGIVSGDRDLFALVADPGVFVLYPRKGVSDLARIDEAEIERRYGVPGRRYFDFSVLRGDPSDGLPGVRGVGEKTAAALVRAHGSL